MKFVHLSDLHLGKRVNEFSMIEDQKYVLAQIIGIIEKEAPNGVFIAGDVYDKAVPSAEAVELFDDFLVQLAALKTQVFIISGNHDSPERLAFANRLIGVSGIHISPVYNGEIKPFSLTDEHDNLLLTVWQGYLDESLVKTDTFNTTLCKHSFVVHVVELVLD